MHGLRTPFTRVLVAVCLLWSATPTDTSASGALDLEERIRYQERLEQIYAEQRATSTPASAKATETPSDSELRAKIQKQLKMGDALDQVWGQQINRRDLQTEYDRILAHSNDREMLGRLLGALDRDPSVVAACLIEPILVRRAVHRAYWWDPEIHQKAKRIAEDELHTDDGSGGLGRFSGERTETEWRLGAEGEPLGMEIGDGVQIRTLSREGWGLLLEDLEQRWEIDTEGRAGIPGLQFSPLEETKEHFSTSVILAQDPARLRIATYTWWKRTFSDWWKEHAEEFSHHIGDSTITIDMERTTLKAPPETETKNRAPSADAWFPMNSSDPETPVARTKHTAVWNGNVMIIWGGTDGAQYYSSGGVYDPATDTWSATSQGTNCPQNRIAHSANWLNNRMYIWGGWRGVNDFDTGAIYNPSTDTWTEMAQDANTPTARRGHAGFNLIEDDALYIWGGAVLGSPGADGAIYRDGAWSPWNTAGEPVERNDFVAVTDDFHGNFIVWGGRGDWNFSFLDNGGKFDVDPPAWDGIPSAGAPSERKDAAGVISGGVCTSSPAVIIWGGQDDTVGYLDTGGIYNPAGSGSWIGATPEGDNLPTRRISHTAVMDTTTDRMIVWGGTIPSYGSVDTGGVLDLCDDSWTATDLWDADLPGRRLNHTAVWTGKSMIVWGGNFAGTEYDDGGVYTHCWGPPTTSLTPIVTDEDGCVATGIRISWPSAPTWNDYSLHRRVSIVRDSAVIASDLLPSDGSYLDTTAVEDQSYNYQVRFTNSCGESVTTTSVSGIDMGSSAPTVTSAPAVVDADGCNTSSGIDISWPVDPDNWGDNGEGDRKYRVWRYRNSFEGWVALGSQLDYGVTSYHDPNPIQASYRIKYISGCGMTTDSPESPMVQDLAGSAPTVSQTAAATDPDVCLHTGNSIAWPSDPDGWGDGGTGDRFYRVRRSANGVDFNPIGSNITYGTTSFVDTTANPDQEYHYQVRYKNGCDLAGDSGIDTATDQQGAAPTLTANSTAIDTDTCIDGGITISWPTDPGNWGDGGSGTRTYDVLRDGAAVETGIAQGTTSSVDLTGVNGTAYLYQVRYNNGCGLDATTTGDNGNDRPFAPAAPANNTASDIDACAATGVLVSWNADPEGPWGDSGGTHTYQVLRDGVIAQSGIAYGVTTYTDTTGTLGTPYVYTVRYVNCGALHSETTGATVADINDTPATPASPVVTDASACAQDGVWINWTPSAGAATYDLRVDGATDLTSVTDPYLYNPGDSFSHTYEVRANGALCPGDWSQPNALPDLIDPDAQFCDGFRSGDTSAWAVTSP